MKFRKKPIVVEAYQLTDEKEIHTREGTVKGYPGDWIITGIQGEIYPCGKEIFEQTYEPADSRPAPASPDALEIVARGKAQLDECEHDGFSTQIIQAKRDVLCWVEQELRQNQQGGERR